MILENLLSVGTGVVAAVANHVFQSSALALLAGLLVLLLRRNRAQVRYAVWLVASIKFLIPFSLLVAVGNLFPRHSAIVLRPAILSGVEVAGQPFSGFPAAHPTTVHSLYDGFGALVPGVLMTLWFCGAVTVLFVWYLRWQQVRLTLKQALPVTNGREVRIMRRLEVVAGTSSHIEMLESRDIVQPGVFGVSRPVLLWPKRLSEELNDEHIAALIAHELAHVSRHDNLTAAIHMVVESLFWFNPMVWWMERRLIEERERACDESVIQMGVNPESYAESLVKACRICVEPPLTCISGICRI